MKEATRDIPEEAYVIDMVESTIRHIQSININLLRAHCISNDDVVRVQYNALASISCSLLSRSIATIKEANRREVLDDFMKQLKKTIDEYDEEYNE